ncbi:unnamed protein product [Cylindrotheca closterium]|uniref:DUF6824 domain-containing protein n=1 Tax=Cylindrotheca closterium TaxID=2856 RepID=A0AAD2PWA2_9STRA|nr:unnamed protein product [Cylindrotheca closterium]
MVVNIPTAKDVIIGKGRDHGHDQHPGNQYWIHLMRERLEHYDEANEVRMSVSIYKRVQETGARFLKCDDNGDYFELTDEAANRKTLQCLVDMNHQRTYARGVSPFFVNNWTNTKVDGLCSTLRTTTSTLKNLSVKFSATANFAKLVGALKENQSLKKLSVNLTICKDFSSTEAMVSMLCMAASNHPEISSLTIKVPVALGKTSTKAIVDLIRVSTTLHELRVVGNSSLSTAIALQRYNRDDGSSKKRMKVLEQNLMNSLVQQNHHLKILAIPHRIAGGHIRFIDFLNFVWNNPRLECVSILGMEDMTDDDIKMMTNLPRRNTPLVWKVDSRMAHRCQDFLCQLLKAHPEILVKPAGATGVRKRNALPPKVQFWVDFRREGRYLLQRPDLPLPAWPRVLLARGAKPGRIYEFLRHGPFFAGRGVGFVQDNHNHEPPVPAPVPPKKKKEIHNSRKRKFDEMNAKVIDAMDQD